MFWSEAVSERQGERSAGMPSGALNSTSIRTILPVDLDAPICGAITHHEFVAYLEGYVDRHRLPVRTGVAVEQLN